MKSEIQQRFEDVRIILNYPSIRQMAYNLGILPQDISDLKRGKVQKMSMKIYKAFQSVGINPDWIMTGEGKMKEVSYKQENTSDEISDNVMNYGVTPDITKMTIEEMKIYYHSLNKHNSNMDKIKTLFEALNLNLND